jgi:hypothetical protein
MGYATLAASLVIALAAGACAATDVPLPAPLNGDFGPVAICLNPAGDMVRGRVTCSVDPGGKTRTCVCPSGSLSAITRYCSKGEKPVRESPAASRARHAAVLRGDLTTASFEGGRFCLRGRVRATGIADDYNNSGPTDAYGTLPH